MPGYAGSSWYFLRYMDPQNDKEFCDRKASDYWNQVDIYIGGTEHAVGHLLYSRMWTKVLFDLGHIGFDEPYKRLVNQGMITGKSYYLDFIKKNDIDKLPGEDYEKALQEIYYLSHGTNSLKNNVHIEFVEADEYFAKVTGEETVFGEIRIKNAHYFVDTKDRLTEPSLKKYIAANIDLFMTIDDFVWEIELTEDGERYVQCKCEVEKMSKSKFNVVNPDDLVAKYGADTFRMYEMFLGPVEMSKPWDTKGIEGVHRFLKKLWRLFIDETKNRTYLTEPPFGTIEGYAIQSIWNNEQPTNEELKVLHKAIKKIEEDTERFSFNTAVSGFMIATNELTDLNCHKRKILEPILILLAPYAPHIAAELYAQLRQVSPGGGDLEGASYPIFEAKYIAETSKEYPISVNGKLRTTMNISLDAAPPEVEKLVLANEVVQKWLEGKPHKKIIFVKNKMVNVVV